MLYAERQVLTSEYDKEIAEFSVRSCSVLNWISRKGTKQDLWNTVSPKMAQRVFSGMLNESLSILVARFIHGRPSLARSMQFWSDAFNVLRCTAYLSLSACNSGDEMKGCNVKKLSTYARDIHAKCNELLICLLLRGAPLEVLFQVFRNGLDDLTISHPRQGPSPWIYISAPNLFGVLRAKSRGYGELSEDRATILELYVLKSQPQPSWSQLIKALSMSDFALGRILLRLLMRQCIGQNMPSKPRPRKVSSVYKNSIEDKDEGNTCGGFLCAGISCKRSLLLTPVSGLHALVYVLTGIGGCEPRQVVLPAIKLDPGWSGHLDRQQVWNQDRPPWLNALLAHVQPIMNPIIETLLDAVKTGASTYQAMSLVLACFGELFECLPLGVLRMSFAMDENMPAHCQPIGGSVILQLLCTSLYSALHEKSSPLESNSPINTDSASPQVQFDEQTIKESNKQNKVSEHYSGLMEALCSIDEDDKHTAQITELLSFVRESLSRRQSAAECSHVADIGCVVQTHTDELGFTETGRTSLKIVHEYVIRSWKTLLELLKSGGDDQNLTEIGLRPLALLPTPSEPLTKIMFKIEESPFDELLHEYEGAHWDLMLGVPLGVSKQRVRAQVLSRPELANILRLDRSEREAAHFVKQLCTTGTITKRK
ncbi:hypothetical protein QAD02_005182 [Eretmocerus hayati]|uniref:Uncharacterized protein n=1 Tax=Eretmocerus hayati TaxID=131215 RepID=A0ACC2NWJ4_9HYME|nr:hypothetical protein QAD02_005182 [Eretmocerus hayati]